MTAYTPDLPSLVTALPGDHTRAPQTEFTRARQVLFLENLSLTGSVRSAAAAAGVSHQTAYRARRGTGAFRLAWDAALVTARANAEVVLAARAIDGVEEKVFYHGEEVATRTRYSDRLLLAHLGRLDRLTADERVNAFAEDFDAELARFAAGEKPVPATPAAAGNFSSPEPCNTRSMSYPSDDAADPITGEHLPELERRLRAMEAAKPRHAPILDALYPMGECEAEQLAAFEEGVEEWWMVVPAGPDDDPALWHYADEDQLRRVAFEADRASGCWTPVLCA